LPQFVSSGLIALGGVLGFVKRGSYASLIAGGGSGALLGYGVQLQRANPANVQLLVSASTSRPSLPHILLALSSCSAKRLSAASSTLAEAPVARTRLESWI